MIIKTNSDEIQSYLIDASNFKGNCNTVYIPENENEIIELFKECNRSKTEITISGNGTGLTGARVPEGGIVLSIEKLNKIIEINEVNKYIIVQPGVILKDLQDFVESKRLFYPPDPTERNCFIGSTVATNSSGARTFKYGPTRNYVQSLRIILPNGEILNISRGEFSANNYDALLTTESGKIISFTLPDYEMPHSKNAAGYFCKKNMDLIDLFIGSEGTLGVITEVKLKLIELPQNIFSCVAFFNSEDDALNFISEAREISRRNNLEDSFSEKPILSALGLEFFDEQSLKFLIKDYPKIPKEDKAAVWFEQEIENNEQALINTWIDLLNKYNCQIEHSWIAIDKNDEESFKEFRHAISWKVNEFIAQRGLKKVGTDIAVPDNSFKDFYFTAKQLVENYNIDYVIYGHFGNSHIHLNMLPKNDSEFIIAKNIYSELCRIAIELKGTVSAEHGIGKSKREYLLNMYDEKTIKEMALLKLVFDPNKILCIGNIFDPKYLD